MKHFEEERQWKAERQDKGDLYLDYDDELKIWIILGKKSKYCYEVYDFPHKGMALGHMNRLQRRFKKKR